VYRARTRRGYFFFRRSRHSRWKFHVVYTSNGRYFWGYVPRKPRAGIIALIHGFRFRGKIEREQLGLWN